MKRRIQVAVVVTVIAALWYNWPATPRAWTTADIEILKSLSIDSLGPLPIDATL